MIAFLIRRIIQAIIVVLLVLLGLFLLTHVIPGGAARAALGPRATKAQIRQFNVTNNYFKGIFVQFYLYLKTLVWHHNLGYSYKMNQDVTTVIAQRLPKTLVLVGHLDIAPRAWSSPCRSGSFKSFGATSPSTTLLTRAHLRRSMPCPPFSWARC